MTNKVIKSAIAAAQLGDFSAAVQKHIAALTVWAKHDAAVKAQAPLGPQPKWGDFAGEKDQGKLYLTANEKWQNANKARITPYPRDATHPLIEGAVKEVNGAFVSDFEIVNDDPTDAQVLRGKKDALLHKIYLAEQDATNAVMPPIGKRRLINMREADVLAADGALSATIAAQTPKVPNVAAEVAKRRDAVSTKLLQDQAACGAKAAQISRNAAEAMSAVEDLTLDNIDNYQMPALG